MNRSWLMFNLRRITNQIGCKTDMKAMLRFRVCRAMTLMGLDIIPLFPLFLLPKKFLTLPMWSTITPKEEINIKTRTNESLEIINHESNNLGGDREEKMPITLTLNMKTSGRSTETRL
jgi:hypothetical protein